MLIQAEDAAINSQHQLAFAFSVFLLLLSLVFTTFPWALSICDDQAVSMVKIQTASPISPAWLVIRRVEPDDQSLECT